MSRRYKNAIWLQPGPLPRQLLCFVEQRSWHHAAIHDNNPESLMTIVQHNRAGVQLRLYAARTATGHSAIHENWELERCNVNGRSTDSKSGNRTARREKRGETKQEGGKSRHQMANLVE